MINREKEGVNAVIIKVGWWNLCLRICYIFSENRTAQLNLSSRWK
jgi:hypothetical protein